MIINTLSDVIINMAWAGKFLTASIFPAPRYWETIEEIALLVCPKTQISIDKNVETIPTAAKDVVAFESIFPMIAASVKDKIGSDTPEIKAGIASLLIWFKVIEVLKVLIHNNEKGIHFVLGSKCLLIFYNREVRKSFGFFCSEKTYLIE